MLGVDFQNRMPLALFFEQFNQVNERLVRKSSFGFTQLTEYFFCPIKQARTGIVEGQFHLNRLKRTALKVWPGKEFLMQMSGTIQLTFFTQTAPKLEQKINRIFIQLVNGEKLLNGFIVILGQQMINTRNPVGHIRLPALCRKTTPQ